MADPLFEESQPDPTPIAVDEAPTEAATGHPQNQSNLDAFADDLVSYKKFQLKASAAAAPTVTPEQQAEANKAGGIAGVPPEVFLRHPELVEPTLAQHKLGDVNELFTKHHQLAVWLSTHENMKLAQNDVPKLKTLNNTISLLNDPNADRLGILQSGHQWTSDGNIEDTATGKVYTNGEEYTRHLKLQGQIAEADIAAANYEAAQFKKNYGTAGRVGANFVMGAYALPGAFLTGEARKDYEDGQRLMANVNAAERTGHISQFFSEDVPGFAGSLATAALPGGLLGKAVTKIGIGATLTEASTASQILGQGVRERALKFLAGKAPAAAAAIPMTLPGAIEAGRKDGAAAGTANFLLNEAIFGALGHSGAAKLMLPSAGNTMAATSSGELFKKLGLESTAQFLGMAGSVTGGRLIEKTLGSDDHFDKEQFFHELVSGGVIGALTPYATLRSEVKRMQLERLHSAYAGMAFSERLTQANAIVKETTLGQVSPRSIGDLAEKLSGGKDTAVYMQVQDWTDGWTKEGIDPAVAADKAGLAKEYQEALAGKRSMTIPLKTYLQAMTDAENPATFDMKARRTPGVHNGEEGANFIVSAPDEMAKANKLAMDEAAKSLSQPDPSADKIAEDVKAQLIISQPHLKDDLIEHSAQLTRAFFKTEVDRFNAGLPEGVPKLDAYEFYKRYNLKISGESPSPEVAAERKAKLDAKVTALLDMMERGEKPDDPAMEEMFNNLKESVDKVGGMLNEENVKAVKSAFIKDIASRMGVEYEQSAKPSYDISHLSPEAQAYFNDRPAAVQQELISTVNARRDGKDQAGDLGNLQQHEQILKERNPQIFNQEDKEPRGRMIRGARGANSIDLEYLSKQNFSTFVHEPGHFFFEVIQDLAAMEHAPEALKRDVQSLYEWLGVKNRGEIETVHHERIARALERYMMEGKAPAPELKGMFDQFKQWLKSVYKTLKNSALSVNLTDEVRGVFDRMLASDDAIAMAIKTEHAEPLFPDAKSAGMTDEQFALYSKAVEKNRQSAVYDLERKAIDALRKEQSDQYKERRTKIMAGIKAQVDNSPAFVAMRALQEGKDAAGNDLLEKVKLDKEELIELYGEDKIDHLPGRSKNQNSKGAQVYSVKDGVPLEEAAALFGFKTGDDLYRALAEAPNRKGLIEEQTDTEMARLYPDPVEDGTFADDAVEALYTNRHADVLMTELDSLGQRIGKKSIPLEIVRNSAKNTIEHDRKVRDLNPEVFHQAAINSSREVVELVAKGKWDEAFIEQQRRIMNEELYRAALEAKKDTEKMRADAAKWDNDAFRKTIGKAGGWEWTVGDKTFTTEAEAVARGKMTGEPVTMSSGYLEQGDALLEQYDFKRVSNKQAGRQEALAAWLQTKAEEGDITSGVPEWVANTTGKQNWKNLTTVQLRDVTNALKNIEMMARLKNQLISFDEKVSLQEAVSKLSTQAEESGRNSNEYEISKAKLAKLADGVRDTSAWLTKLGAVVRLLDGGKHGVWADRILTPLQKAADRQVELEYQSVQALKEAYNAWGKADWFGQKREFFPEIKQHLTLENRIMIALNAGSKDNKVKMLEGHGWNEEQLRSILNTLDEKDKRFISAIYKVVGRDFAEVQRQERRTTGTDVVARELTPIVTDSWVLEGGYIPISSDSSRDITPPKEVGDRPIGKSINLNKSFTKEVSKSQGKPMALTFDVITSHLNKQSMWLSHQEVLRDINKLIQSPEIQEVVARKHSLSALKIINDTLKDIAQNDSLSRGLVVNSYRHLRAAGMMGVMALKTVTSIVNMGGLLPAATRVDKAALFANAIKYIPSVLKDSAFLGSERIDKINAKSSMMRDRFQRNTVNQDLRQLSTSLASTKAGAVSQSVERGQLLVAYYLQNKTQQIVDYALWETSYNKALKEYPEDDAKAVAIANQDVIDTQGSGQAKDLSKLQRRDFSRILTTFYGYGNSQLNLFKGANADLSREFGQHPVAATAKFLADYALIGAGPIIFEELVRASLQHKYQDKDEDEKLKAYGEAGLNYAVGLFPVGRNILSLAQKNLRGAVPLPLKGVQTAAVGSWSAASDLVSLGENQTPAHVKDEIEAAKLAVPPLGAIYQRWQDYVEDPTMRTAVFGPQPKR